MLIVTKMKNEGPFILEWLAHHMAIGVTDFLVYTNDCSDGTDGMLDVLQKRGLVQHRENPFRKVKKSIHHAVYSASLKEQAYKRADWIVTMDVDEFINIHVGDGTLTDLFAAVPNANLISITWRVFGNNFVHEFRDEPVTEQFTRCSRP
ncbi:MAG: glycosyltransferase family 2 protein [Pseudomonadota bacterium]